MTGLEEQNEVLRQALGEVVAELQEANRWLRVLAEPVLRERLLSHLKEGSDRKVYQASTGVGTRDVEKATGVSKSAVATMWVRWVAAGIMKPTGTVGRYERVVSLSEFGIEV